MGRSRVELFEQIRRDRRVEKLSIRELADRHHVHRRTVRQALASAIPPARKAYAPRSRPAIDPYVEVIDGWLLADREVPRKQELADPDMVKLYRLLSEALDWPADEPRIVEIADVLERLMARALDAGEPLSGDLDDPFVDLLDTTMLETSPLAGRLLAILEERGWRGWTRIERLPPE